MTAIAISGMGLTGVLRLTWVQDNLAHVLDYSRADETSGTWTISSRLLCACGRVRQWLQAAGCGGA